MRHHHSLRVGPVAFRIGSDWAAPIDAVRRLYAAYPQPTDGFTTATVRLEANRWWRRFIRPAVHIRGDYTIPDALPLPLAQGLLAAEMAMNLQVALGWRQHLLLHASAVERDGRALVMVGASGSGKSTLAALLGEGDWRLMGDEFALLGLDSGAIHAFPRMVSLKNEAVAEMARRIPAERFGPLIAGTPKGSIRHLIPRADAIARMDEPATPALLMFPEFGGEPGLRAIPPSEAFLRLTDSSTNYVTLGEPAFAALVRLVKDVPAVAIGYGSSAEGIAAVEALWREVGQ
jgi:HprK-related kinase A